ncbi:MAG TPA: Holliday junction branch migration protein RuvA [Symbiobacteriaceae bacterium]|jgi:Holliday junction DNA helicase RuvA
MIAHVRGELAATMADSVVIDVGGVGYRCLVPNSTRSQMPGIGQQVRLHTSMQVREDSMTLYGFLTREEFDLFELLLKVESIGPKLALGVLSGSTTDGLRRAIALADVTALCRVPGIGKKTAQRIILELKDKVGAFGPSDDVDAPMVTNVGVPQDVHDEALEALMALGYSRAEAAAGLEKAKREAGESPRLETLVRLSLKHLFRG